MYRLLIVDDETYIADGIAELFESTGLPLKEIRRAYSADQAMDLFVQTYFDIVIADIRMPEMDGLTFCEKLRDRWSRVKIVFLTGFADFEYARRAMKLGACDFLLKPADDQELLDSIRLRITELQSEAEQMMALHGAQQDIQASIPDRQEKFIRIVLESGDRPESFNLSAELRQSGLPFQPEGGFLLFMMRFDSWEQRFQQGDEQLVVFAVRNMLEELVGADWHHCFFPYSGFVAAVLQPTDEEDGESTLKLVEKIIEHIQDAIYSVLGVMASIIYSNRNVKLAEWATELRAMSGRLSQLSGEGKLIACNTSLEPLNVGTLQEWLSELRVYMEAGDVAGFEQLLERLIAGKDGRFLERPFNLGVLFIEISRELLQLCLRQHQSGLLESDTIGQLSNLNIHRSPANMKRFFVDTLSKMIAYKRSVEENSSERLVREAKTYINRHLNQILSLDEISRSIYVNASYLSRIFHQVTGEPISAYITRMKLEEAKKLLLEANAKVLDVSGRLGYENPNYFAKVFRKHVGLSPQEYRNIYLPK